MRLVVVCPHFDPDSAPTGRVMSRIVEELASRGHHVDVVTALPWYRRHRVEPEWQSPVGRRAHDIVGVDHQGQPVRHRRQAQPRPPRTRVRRVLGARRGSRLAAGGWFRRADAVIAMSPPLTMGVTGRIVAWTHRCPLVFNVQDVFPDAAVATGAVTNPVSSPRRRGWSDSAIGWPTR